MFSPPLSKKSPHFSSEGRPHGLAANGGVPAAEVDRAYQLDGQGLATARTRRTTAGAATAEGGGNSITPR